MSSSNYRFGEFTLSKPARELRHGNDPVALSPRAFDCLVHLIENRDRAVGKDELVLSIWGRPNVSDTQLGQTVLRARRAVGDDGQVQHFIRTVSRYGYRWIADVETDEAIDAVPSPIAPAATNLAAVPTHENATVANEPASAAPKRRPWNSRALFFTVGAIGVLAVAVVLTLHHFAYMAANDHAATTAQMSTTVLPLHVDADADSAWLRLGAMDLIAERLRGAGLTVPPSESVVALLQTLKGADANSTTRALRSTTPGALLVRGSLTRDAKTWTTRLQATTADGAVLQIESSQPDALSSARNAADRLLGRLGRARPPQTSMAGGLQERLQHAQAAMLANDLDAARAILISDPVLAREEPQLGYRLAQVDFRSGDYARAEVSLSALLNEPAASDPLFHARLLNARGAVRIRMDDYVGAESDYGAAIALLRGGRHASELGLALTGRGVSRSMRGNFAPALADLGEARVQLETAGDTLAVARVDMNLGGLEMNRDRPERALSYLDSAATQFERYGAINELMETLESLVSDNLALLRPDDALAASDRSWALANRVTDPNQRVDLALDRIDVFLALGRLREAGALLDALPDALPGSNPFVARRLPLLRARLAFAEGRYDDAAAQARRAIALRAPGDDRGEGVAEIALLLQRALLATATQPTASKQPSVASQDEPQYPVQALRIAEWASAHRDDAEAARQFRSALDLAEQRGVPADVALVTASYGPWLLAHGRVQEAGEIIGRVSPWASRDFDCALLQVRLFSALRQPEAWSKALAQAKALASERPIPAELREAPR